jgi:hypothetical protein
MAAPSSTDAVSTRVFIGIVPRRALTGGGRAAERRVVEDRVVAETVRPTRLGRNLAIYHAFGFVGDASALRDRDIADEPGRTTADPALAQELVDSAKLHGVVRACPPCGMDARDVVERGDFDARVVGDAGESDRIRVVQRFQPRVVRERGPRFLRLDDRGKVSQGEEFDLVIAGADDG